MLLRVTHHYAQTEAMTDLFTVNTVSEIAKQAQRLPRFWSNFKLDQLDELQRNQVSELPTRKFKYPETVYEINMEANNQLQFLLDSVAYSFIQHSVSLLTDDNVFENYSTLVYGSVMSLQGVTVSFAATSHFLDSSLTSHKDHYDGFFVGSYQVGFAELDVRKWVQWLRDVRQMLAMSQAVSLYRLWQVLKFVMIPSHCSSIW